MAENGFIWIYLIFFLIPAAKLLPRLIKKLKNKSGIVQPQYDTQYNVSNEMMSESNPKRSEISSNLDSKPKTTEMLVLGELTRGTKNFDSLQKILGIDNDTLNSVLENLENKGLMRVEQNQGLFGPKVELYQTEEGIKKFYS